MVSVVAPDYDRLSRLLVGAELAPSPAEAQGMLCGLLALHLPDAHERWQAQLLEAPMVDPGVDPISAEYAESHSSCEGHAHINSHPVDHDHDHDHDHRHAAVDSDVDAHPDDFVHTDADERHAALDQLASWTQSALDPSSLSFDLLLPPDDRSLQERASAVLDWVRGLLFGFALGGLRREQLLGQAAEAFDDLVELTRMDLEAVAEDEADDEALTEIVEFLRVAAMLIREDRAKALIDERDQQVAETGLH